MAAKKNQNTILKFLSQMAVRSTTKSANTTCVCWQYQPKESEKIKKLRKF